jgi:hypothetical protein
VAVLEVMLSVLELLTIETKSERIERLRACCSSLRTLIEPRSIGRAYCETAIIVRSAVIPPNLAPFS